MWTALDTIALSNTWQLTPSVSGTLFRVSFSHALWGRGLIAQVPIAPPLELANVRKLYGRETSIYRFEQPACLPNRAIAVMQYSGAPWTVDIDVWTGLPDELTLLGLQSDLQRIEAKIDLL
jgi:hypothetical protein